MRQTTKEKTYKEAQSEDLKKNEQKRFQMTKPTQCFPLVFPCPFDYFQFMPMNKNFCNFGDSEEMIATLILKGIRGSMDEGWPSFLKEKVITV